MTTAQPISTTAVPERWVTVRDTMEALTAVMGKVQESTTILQEDRENINLFMHLSLDLARVLQGQTDQFKTLSEKLTANNGELACRLYKQYASRPQMGGTA